MVKKKKIKKVTKKKPVKKVRIKVRMKLRFESVKYLRSSAVDSVPRIGIRDTTNNRIAPYGFYVSDKGITWLFRIATALNHFPENAKDYSWVEANETEDVEVLGKSK